MSETMQGRAGRSPTMLEQVGDFARPFAIYVSAGSAAIAVVKIAEKVTNFSDAAIFIGAVFAGVGAIYTAKSWENGVASKQDALVKVAQANAAAPVSPVTIMTPPAPDLAPS